MAVIHLGTSGKFYAMSGEKKFFVVNGVRVKMYTPYDLKKQWFVEWKEADKRPRRFGKVNHQPTRKLRMAAIKRLAESLKYEISPPLPVERIEMEKHIKTMTKVWKKSTVTNVQSIVRKYFEWLDGRKANIQNTEAFFVWLRKNRHTTTHNEYKGWLGNLFTAIGREGMLDGVKKLKTEKTPARYFQPHQVEKLREYIQINDPMLWHYIEFIYYCFIRPGRELPHVKAGDIMMEEGEIFIRGSRSKNKKTQYVCIPDHFYQSLDYVYDLEPGEYLFPSFRDASKPLGRNTMYDRHQKILKKLNFGKGFCLYSWKHTGAVMAVKAGVSVKELQLQLRHHSLDETDKYLRQLGIKDVSKFRVLIPNLNKIVQLAKAYRPKRSRPGRTA